MIAAIYSRKSTEQNGVADETKSVTRQIEHAKAYAARKGWNVADEYVFVDDGISGAEFAKRPALLRLLNAVAAKPRPFDVLVMSEESRLGREMVKTMGALMQIVTSGVKVFYYLEDKERTLDSAMEKGMMAMAMFGADLEREKAHQRTRDSMLHRAQAGYVTGGACFGYRNVRTGRGVTREIDPEEAVVVRRIFELCAAGKGSSRTCQTLNEEGAPAPRAQQRRPHGWVTSSVRAVLYRDLYRGEQVWGRSRKRNTWGQIACSRNPETAWVRTSVPALRIVSDELWDAAHERLATSRLNYLRATDGKLWGKPANGIESKYLLTGMTTCGGCGGGMLVYPRTHGSPGRRKRVHVYACPRARVSLCPNDLEVPMALADAAVLAMIADEVLSPEVIQLAIDKLMGMFDAPAEDVDERRATLTDALRRVGKELAYLQAAVAAGEPPETLLAGIRERERQQKDLRAQASALDAEPAVRAAAPQIKCEAMRLLADWRGLLGKHVATSRQLLRKLLDKERFVFYPQAEGAERWYDVSVRPTLDRFLNAVPVLKKAVASPTGFEPVF